MTATVVSENTITLFSHDSCTCTVPAGQPTDIDDKFVGDAVVKECQFVASKEPAPAAKELVSIEKAIEDVVLEGSPDTFNSLNGQPKVAVISDRVGRKVTAKEIQFAWDAVMAAESTTEAD